MTSYSWSLPSVSEVKSLSRVRLFATPWTVAYQAPPSMGFSRQEYWSGAPSPSLEKWYKWTYLQAFRLHVWRRRWHPTPGESHGWRSLVGCSPWGHEESDTTERLHFYCSLSCIGEGNGNPLQCSCLENPRDGGAWWLPSMGSHRVGHDWSDLADLLKELVLVERNLLYI